MRVYMLTQADMDDLINRVRVAPVQEMNASSKEKQQAMADASRHYNYEVVTWAQAHGYRKDY